MKSRTTKKFRAFFTRLPKQVQTQARVAYRLFKQNPNHPSLRFKKVHSKLPGVGECVMLSTAFLSVHTRATN